MATFSQRILTETGFKLTGSTHNTLQVNVGNRCNHLCTHCHVQATPESNDIMSWELIPTNTDDYTSLAGLWTVLLNDKGKAVTQPIRVMNMDFNADTFQLGETSPHKIISTENVPFYLSMINIRFSESAREQETYVVTLDKTGAYSGKVLLDPAS